MSSSKLPLSVVMIAKNEAHRIARALHSIHDIASEIILVINNTTDNTQQIAEQFGATVFIENQWRGFRDQKTLAVNYSSQPWIFSLDADEELSPQLKSSIIQFINENNPAYDVAYFNRRVWFLGRWIYHGDWYPDHCHRIWRKGKALFSGPSTHEKLSFDPNKVIHLKGDLFHYTYPNMVDWLNKFDPFSESFLQDLIKKQAKWNPLKVILRSFWRFFRSYFIRLGFLDGYPGFYIACMQFFYTLYKYTRLYEYHHKNNLPPHW